MAQQLRRVLRGWRSARRLVGREIQLELCVLVWRLKASFALTRFLILWRLSAPFTFNGLNFPQAPLMHSPVRFFTWSSKSPALVGSTAAATVNIWKSGTGTICKIWIWVTGLSILHLRRKSCTSTIRYLSKSYRSTPMLQIRLRA